jgi:hypothetical protein
VSGFLSGYKFLVIPHPEGKHDKEMVIELYSAIVESIDNHQEEKIERDFRKLYCLNEWRYFVALRERVGVQSENERVRLGEFGIPGRLYPVFQSDFIIWDKSIGAWWKSVIKELTIEGGEIEDLTEIPV